MGTGLPGAGLIDLMATTPLMAEVPSGSMEALADRGRVRDYRRATYLFHQGDDPSEVFFLVRGRIEVSSSSSLGHERLLTILENPQFFGELEVLSGNNRGASALARDDAAVWVVRDDVFLAFVAEQPQAARSLLASLGRRLEAQDDFIQDLIWLDLRGRVAKWLLALSSLGSAPGLPRRSESIAALPLEGELMTPQLTQGELAHMCGGSRENVARILSEFQRRGLIEKEGHRYRLKDARRLRRLASV
jgi:CRP-like cAMP-binding protein